MQTVKVLKQPLDAPIGTRKMVYTPWGSYEEAHVFTVMDITDGPIQYATIYNSPNNFKVRCSSFRVRK
jgi:hypothetical protein